MSQKNIRAAIAAWEQEGDAPVSDAEVYRFLKALADAMDFLAAAAAAEGESGLHFRLLEGEATRFGARVGSAYLRSFDPEGGDLRHALSVVHGAGKRGVDLCQLEAEIEESEARAGQLPSADQEGGEP